jgi:hypothetical protein
VQPGWYEDPFARGSLRWWDGYAWTSHQAPAGAPPGQAPLYGVWQSTPQGDLATEQKWAEWAGWSFIAIALFGAVGDIVIGPWLGHYFRDVFDTCTAQLDSGQTSCDTGQSHTLALDGIALLTIGPQLIMMIWLFQTAKIAKRLGLPARREPGWAFGFFVPIVNFWFPYQVARDTLPPGHPGRSTVGWWWAFTLVQGFAIVPVVIVGAFSTTNAVLVGVLAASLPVLAALTGRRMVGEVLAEHRRVLTTG